MARKKTTQAAYDSVFESGRSRRGLSARVVAQPSAAPAGIEDIVAFVEDQTRAITAAVRLAAQQLPCSDCVEGTEPHYHGSKLYEAGREIF